MYQPAWTRETESADNEPSTDYYVQKARESIDATLAECEGKTAEEIRHLLRRHYPFDLPRGGTRAYKVWNREIHRAEALLGLEPRKHRSRKSDRSEDDEYASG